MGVSKIKNYILSGPYAYLFLLSLGQITCFVHAVSPVKKAAVSGKSYFNLALQTDKSVKRAVCFSPDCQQRYKDMELAKSPVKLSNYLVKNNDVLLNKSTLLKPLGEVPFEFNSKLSCNSVLSLIDLDRLAPEQLVSIKCEVSELTAVKKSGTGDGILLKQEAVLRDATACCKLLLYNKHVDLLETGKTYTFHNLRLKLFKNVVYLNTPRLDEFTFEESEPLKKLAGMEKIGDLTTSSIIARIVGVHTVRKYLVCCSCNKKIFDSSTDLIKCGSCGMSQLASACCILWFSKIMLRELTCGTQHVLAFLNDTFLALLDVTNGDQTVSEDEMAKFLLGCHCELQIDFDLVDKRVTSVKLAT